MSKNIEVCTCNVLHNDRIDKVKSVLPKEECLYDLAEFFKIFGDSTRIKIIFSLYQSEMCVCDLAETIHISQSGVSHQLRLLKQMGVVKFRKEGRTVFYSLDDNHIYEILTAGFAHICHKFEEESK